MRSFVSFHPGEVRGCTGCHETRAAAPGSVPSGLPLALRRGASAPVPPPWGTQVVSFLRDIQPVLDRHCASCHGRSLEGQPDWQSRNSQGRLPAPPHDEHGHTWHHDDQVLFEVTKYGLARHAPAGYQSDMPAFEGTLSDEDIVAVLAFIKSRWPALIHDKRREAGMN